MNNKFNIITVLLFGLVQCNKITTTEHYFENFHLFNFKIIYFCYLHLQYRNYLLTKKEKKRKENKNLIFESFCNYLLVYVVFEILLLYQIHVFRCLLLYNFHANGMHLTCN